MEHRLVENRPLIHGISTGRRKYLPLISSRESIRIDFWVIPETGQSSMSATEMSPETGKGPGTFLLFL